MKLTIVGSGDAFGAGGRLNTCFHVRCSEGVFLIDCGATALIGMRRYGLDPNEISTIFITHLHGDHFAGLAWFLIDAAHVSKRTAPVLVAGPEGIEERFIAATDALFPGATGVERKYDLTFVSYSDHETVRLKGVYVTAFEVKHYSGAPPYALRFAVDEKILTYTGDTEWVDALLPAAADADLLIAECYQYDVKLKFHLDYKTLAENFGALRAKRILLTHMSEAMLARCGDIDTSLCLPAEDGMTLDI